MKNDYKKFFDKHINGIQKSLDSVVYESMTKLLDYFREKNNRKKWELQRSQTTHF